MTPQTQTQSSRIQRRLWKAGRLERLKSVPVTRVPAPVNAGAAAS